MIDYALVDDDLALLWMVNMGCIDMNAWSSRVERPEKPDWVIFDLDPSEDVGFPEVIEVALLVKRSSTSSGSRASPKTSGSRGSTFWCRLRAATAMTRREHSPRSSLALSHAHIPGS